MNEDDDKPTRSDVEAVAYRLLSRRGHACTELKRKLDRRDFPKALIDEVVDECVQAGYVDDERFAREQAAILVRKCWGPLQIRNKLRARGVCDVVIDDALAELDEGTDWQETALDRLCSRFGRPETLDDNAQQKAFRHLRYRGYPGSLIRRLLFDHQG